MSGLSDINLFVDFLNEVLGKPGGILINTRILSHSSILSHRYATFDNYVTLSAKGKKVTGKDVVKMFEKIKKNEKFQGELKSGRSYFFEGIYPDIGTGGYYISWGS
jgi:hypothetical protein